MKGGAKTIYFFVELENGDHKIQFFADKTPEIKSFEVFCVKNNKFTLTDFKPPENIESKQKGIPCLSLIFMGTHAKSILVDVTTKSAKEKNNTDGDNLKVIVNGKILQNKEAPTSRKYKNFYFSGDIKSSGILSITNEDLSDPLAFENSVELWYDQEPEINYLQVNFFDTEKFLKELKSLVDLRSYVFSYAWLAIAYFKTIYKPYSAEFLKHSLEKNPESIVFKANHPIVRKIKADPMYKKILEKIKEKITTNILEGEIWPADMGGKINFNSPDLATSIHGIKKIEYKARRKKNGEFEVKMLILDIYDFEKDDVPFFLFHPFQYLKNTILNAVNMGEDLHVVHNFEIKVYINNTL